MRRLSGVVLVSVLVGSGYAPAHAGSNTIAPIVVQEVAPNVFVREGQIALVDSLNQGGIANTGFIVGDSAVAVIDSGGSKRDGTRLLAAIRDRTDLPVQYVINTHVHPDHVFGNSAFVGESPTFVGHARLPRALATRGGHYLEANRALIGPAFEGTQIVEPTLLVSDTLELDLGGRRLHLSAYPTAHTDTDLTVFDPESGALWTGDLLFIDHLPVIDGSLLGWLQVADAMSEIPATIVIPGHGPPVTDWQGAETTQRNYLVELVADLRRHINAGETMGNAVQSAGQSQRDSWLLFEEFNQRNATAGFAELEWE